MTNRTYEDICNDLKTAEEQLGKFKEEVSTLTKEKNDYELSHNMYRPLSDLEQYKGNYIRSISIIEREADGSLSTYGIYADEILEVDNNGHLYYSSFHGGIIEFNEEIDKYVHTLFGCEHIHDFVGFKDIELYEFEED